jgi:hypothetical protein
MFIQLPKVIRPLMAADLAVVGIIIGNIRP